MAMSHDEMIKLVDDLYGACAVGEFEKAATMLTEDFVISESDSLPFACELHGPDALRDLFIMVMGMMDVAEMERGTPMVGGDCLVTKVVFKFTDPSLEPAELLELFRIRDGKVCQIKPYYYDPAPVIAACAAKQ